MWTKASIVVVVLLGVLVYYTGVLDSPAPFLVEQEEAFHFVYLRHQGPFSEVKSVLDGIKRVLDSAGVQSKKAIQVYFDSPKDVEEANMRWFAGYIVTAQEAEKVVQKNVTIIADDVPAGKAIRTSFPFRNGFSFKIGAMKVYPNVGLFMAEKNIDVRSPPVELFDEEHNLIEYRFYLGEIAAFKWRN